MLFACNGSSQKYFVSLPLFVFLIEEKRKNAIPVFYKVFEYILLKIEIINTYQLRYVFYIYLKKIQKKCYILVLCVSNRCFFKMGKFINVDILFYRLHLFL